METGGGVGSYGGDVRPNPADRGDIVQVSPDSRGGDEIPVVAGDLTAMGDPDGAVVGGRRKRRGKAVGGWADGVADGSVDPGEGRRRHRRLEARLDAVVEGLIGKFLLGESASCGGESIRSEQRKEDREDLRVSVYENRVGIVGRAARKDRKE